MYYAMTRMSNVLCYDEDVEGIVHYAVGTASVMYHKLVGFVVMKMWIY